MIHAISSVLSVVRVAWNQQFSSHSSATTAQLIPEPGSQTPAPERAGSQLVLTWPYPGWTHWVPAWGISAFVHFLILLILGLIGIATNLTQFHPLQIQAAPIDPRLSALQAEELLSILADPADFERDQAVGPVSAVLLLSNAPGASGLTGAGSSAQSVSQMETGTVGMGILPGSVREAGPASAKSSLLEELLPKLPERDLSGGGRIAGNVTHETADIGEALDQLAREILRHLEQHKLTIVWLFDESGSMRDDQQAIKDRFDRVAGALKLNLDPGSRSAGILNHVVVGFGLGVHYELATPTSNIDVISQAIDRLPVDESGIENTMGALQRVISDCSKYITHDRKVMVVLVTDESGDDGGEVEAARQLAVRKNVPVYVIGRQSLFGYGRAHMLLVDPVTGDEFWPAIHRGPETAFTETLQWDGLHERTEEQPSGFAPYELARIVKDSGGIYFLLPSEENMRVKQREKAYSMSTLKEYVPSYESREDYLKQRDASELRRTLAEILEQIRGDDYKRHFPVDTETLVPAIAGAVPVARQRLETLKQVEIRLLNLRSARDREAEKRWQAHYDLMLAQVVTYQIQAYEYLACLDEMIRLAEKRLLKPEHPQIPGKRKSEWVLDHSLAMKAPPRDVEKKVIQATALLQDVIRKHPKTPWADLAQDELDRGFGVSRHEWNYNSKYTERAQSVPDF